MKGDLHFSVDDQTVQREDIHLAIEEWIRGNAAYGCVCKWIDRNPSSVNLRECESRIFDHSSERLVGWQRSKQRFDWMDVWLLDWESLARTLSCAKLIVRSSSHGLFTLLFIISHKVSARVARLRPKKKSFSGFIGFHVQFETAPISSNPIIPFFIWLFPCRQQPIRSQCRPIDCSRQWLHRHIVFFSILMRGLDATLCGTAIRGQQRGCEWATGRSTTVFSPTASACSH